MKLKFRPKEFWEVMLSEAEVYQIESHSESPSLFLLAPETVKKNRIKALSQRLQSLEGLNLLHLDIRTPFGDEVDDNQLQAALDEALGIHKSRYQLMGQLLLRIEETHMGSLHRILCFFSSDKAHPKLAYEADRRIPVELGVIGLGLRIAKQTRHTKLQVLIRWKEKVYSLMMVQGEPHHIMRCDNLGSPEQQKRIVEHRLAIVRQEKQAEEAIPLIVFGLDVTTLNSQFASLHPQVGYTFAGMAKLTTALQTPGSALALGLMEAEEQGLGRDVDSAEFIEKNNLREKRWLRVVAYQAALFIFSITLGFIALGSQIFLAQNRGQELRTSAASHAEEVQALKGLRKTIVLQQAKLLSYGPLLNTPVIWSPMLAHISNGTPTAGGIQGLLARRIKEGDASISLQAWTKSWDQVETFRAYLDSLPGTDQVDISEQRKNPATGSVSFQMQVTLQQP